MNLLLDSITLPNGLLWSDEYSWSPVQQKMSYSLDGSLIIQTGIKKAGRPMTLAGSEDYGWIQKSVLDSVKALVNDAEHTIALPDGRRFKVVWKNEEQPVAASPIQLKHIPSSQDYYNNVSFKFWIVQDL